MDLVPRYSVIHWLYHQQMAQVELNNLKATVAKRENTEVVTVTKNINNI